MFALLALTLFAVANAQETLCAGGYRTNDIVQRPPLYYRCDRGNLIPEGCLSNGRRIPVGRTDINGRYEYRCNRGSSGLLELEQSACVQDGRTVRPGDVHRTGDTFFRCDRSGAFLQFTIKGCVVDGRDYQFNEKITRPDGIYQCRQIGTYQAGLEPTACVKDGTEFGIGQMYESQKYFHSCSLKGGQLDVSTVGCMHQGRRYFDQQTYHTSGEVIYRCNIKSDGTASHELAGCVAFDDSDRSVVEKMADCLWIAGQKPYMYIYQCQIRDNTCVKAKIRCVYEQNDGSHMEVPPGCFRNVWNTQTAVGCQKLAGEDLMTRTFAKDDLTTAFSYGLRFC